MTFRSLAFATALTSASALAAHATDSVEDKVIEENGHKVEDMAKDGTMDAAQLEENEYMENGHDVSSVTLKDYDPDETPAEGVNDYRAEALGTLTEDGVVLNAAKEGDMLWTNDGATVGTIYGTRDLGEDGALVLVNVSDDANLPVETIAFPVKTLSAIEEGPGLKYSWSMEQLRDYIVANPAG